MTAAPAPPPAPRAAAPAPARGVFISFEGGDGTGKSTQVGRLAAALRAGPGREVVTTREPGGTPLGAALRELLLHGEDMSPRAEALVYAADRAHHVAALVRPALARGAVVVTDRYLDSSVAYQAGGRELVPSEVEGLSRWATDGLLPDLTILLDLDPVAAAARLTGSPDRLERAGDAFHRRVREAFLARVAAEPERWCVVDAAQGPDAVARQVAAAVEQRLGLRLGALRPGTPAQVSQEHA